MQVVHNSEIIRVFSRSPPLSPFKTFSPPSSHACLNWQLLPLPTLQPLATLGSVSVDMTALDSSQKRDPTLCTFLCLASFPPSRFMVHPHCSMCQTALPFGD